MKYFTSAFLIAALLSAPVFAQSTSSGDAQGQSSSQNASSQKHHHHHKKNAQDGNANASGGSNQ